MGKSRLKDIKNNFLHELQDAYAGKKTSLPFIINHVPSTPLVKDEEVFQTLVIGGSVYKKATLKKENEKVGIVNVEDGIQPLFKTAEDLFVFVEKLVDTNINTISINFAYRIKPIIRKCLSNSKLNALDGILIGGSKENTFDGLVGKTVGEKIELYFRKKKRDVTIAVANDTICLLFAGLTQYKPMMLVGGVVGTGVNLAFFLNEENAVNLESASFDKFPQSKEGKTIDSNSSNRGGWLFEKETAGAYLYKHFNLKIKEKKISYPQISSTEELDIISRKNVPQASEIARGLIKRSAQLVACQIAGITEFKQEDQNIISRHSGKRSQVPSGTWRSASRIPNHSERFWTSSPRFAGEAGQNDEKHHNMIFNMEGSLFWKGDKYKETVEQTVRELIPQHNVKFVEIKDSGILGAAKLVA